MDNLHTWLLVIVMNTQMYWFNMKKHDKIVRKLTITASVCEKHPEYLRVLALIIYDYFQTYGLPCEFVEEVLHNHYDFPEIPTDFYNKARKVIFNVR